MLRRSKSCACPFVPFMFYSRHVEDRVPRGHHNATSRRFALPEREADGDWLDAQSLVDGAPPPLRTSVTVLTPRTILTRNTSPDVPFSQSINAYAGCEHGCIYCFARPTHAYHDLSPGLDFESRLFAKPMPPPCFAPSWPSRLPRRADRAGHQHRPLSADRGRVADHQIDPGGTRGDGSSGGDHDQIRPGSTRYRYPGPDGGQRAGHGLRLGHLARRQGRADGGAPRAHARATAGAVAKLAARVSPPMSRSRPSFPRSPIMRSNIWSPARRRRVPARLLHPHTPAPRGRPAVPRLARHHYPERAGKVMAIIRSLRGGRDNDPDFFTRMKGQGPWAELLRVRFHRACRLHGLNQDRPRLDTSLFRPPRGPQVSCSEDRPASPRRYAMEGEMP